MVSQVMAKAKKAAGRMAGAEPDRVTIVGLKGRPAFAAWVGGLCEHVRLPLPTMLEHALIEYAKTHGFGEEPPKR